MLGFGKTTAKQQEKRYDMPEMAVLPLVIGENNPILRKKTKEVKKITKDILLLLGDMAETLQAAKGAGLAAPQVGRTERICLALIGSEAVALINPHITWRSDTMAVAEEGCLSLPDLWMNVSRPTEIVVEYMTHTGKKREVKLSGFDARVVQHEVDHLEGILITDHRRNAVM